MGRVIPLRPGLRPVSASLAAAHWHDQAAAARKLATFHQAQADLAMGRVARCEALARLAENPTCPPPRATEETGSPTRTEGDPREPA